MIPTEQPPVGLTESELQDWHVHQVTGLLAAKSMEASMAAGDREEAHMHRVAMEEATRARIALRALGNERVGGCYFDCAGQVHANSTRSAN